MEDFFKFDEEVKKASKDSSLFFKLIRITRKKMKNFYVDNIPDESIKKMKPICTFMDNNFVFLYTFIVFVRMSVCDRSNSSHEISLFF